MDQITRKIKKNYPHITIYESSDIYPTLYDTELGIYNDSYRTLGRVFKKIKMYRKIITVQRKLNIKAKEMYIIHNGCIVSDIFTADI